MSRGEKRSKQLRKPLSVWELPKLLQSVHEHRKSLPKDAKERQHFPAILAFVYRNRFATASQIQRRFPQYLRSDRTTRRHLTELEALGYLDTVPTNHTSPLWPKVYFVTRRGARKLQKSLNKRGKSWRPSAADRRRSEGYSAQHVLHELFVTEFLCMVRETVGARDDLELVSTERRALVKHPAFEITENGHMSRLQPDAMFLFRHEGRGMMCCLLELDLGTMNELQLDAKFNRYNLWAGTDAGQEYLTDLYRSHGAKKARAAFRILFVIGNCRQRDETQRLHKVSRIATDKYPALCNQLWLTIVGSLRVSQRVEQPLSQPIWRRCVAGKECRIEMASLFPAKNFF